jgi:hypothetical protein
VGVSRLRDDEAGLIEIGEEFRLETPVSSLSDDVWASVVSVPDAGNAAGVYKVPQYPENPANRLISSTYNISPSNLELEDPARLTISFDVLALNGDEAGIYLLRNGQWDYVGGDINNEAGTISARISRFGTYRVFAGPHGDVPADLMIPAEYSLKQNFPNPFNPVTTIGFNLPHSGNVSLVVYDVLGRLVAKLVDGHMRFGEHQVLWDGKSDNGQSLSSGMYFINLKAGDYTSSKKMVLLK